MSTAPSDPALSGEMPASQSTAEHKRIYLIFDLLAIPAIFLVLAGAFHLHMMLTVGDWDFWSDWKDRRWWPLVMPISLIAFPAAIQYVLWDRFRIPIGATVCIAALMFGIWIARSLNFVTWAYYPINFVWPAIFFGMALLLDSALLLTRSFFWTGIVGGFLWGFLFYPTNWPILSAFRVPVEYAGTLMSVSDVQGFQYVRQATPEYLRIIEEGTLRTYADAVTPLTSLFAGFFSIVFYYLWVWIGSLFSGQKWVKRL